MVVSLTSIEIKYLIDTLTKEKDNIEALILKHKKEFQVNTDAEFRMERFNQFNSLENEQLIIDTILKKLK